MTGFKEPHIAARKRGFSLVEAAIVLGVVGLVIGGIWTAASSVRTNLRQAKIQEDVGRLIVSVRNELHNFPPVTDNSNQNIDEYIVAQNFLPPDWIRLGGTHYFSYGTLTIQPFQYPLTNPSYSRVLVFAFSNGVDARTCVTLVKLARSLAKNCTAAGFQPTAAQLSGDTVNISAQTCDINGCYPFDACSEPELCLETANTGATIQISLLP